jgi:hypothetical protein
MSWDVVMPPGGPADPRRAREILMQEAEQAMRTAALIVEAEWRRRAERSRRTGTYLRSITHRVVRVGNSWVAVVGTNLFYAIYLERGTGLYGPRNQWIYPRRAKALRWPAGGGHGFGRTGAHSGFANAPGFRLSGQQRSGRGGEAARYSYARRVRGIQPRKFAHDAAFVARPRVVAEAQRRGRIAAQRLAAEVRRG